MNTLLIRSSVWLLGLGVIADVWGQTAPPNTNLAGGGISPTEVVIIGALHDFHRKNPYYTSNALQGIILACKPQAILVELPATKSGKPTVRDGRLTGDYARLVELGASQQAAQELKIAIHPFDMDRLDDLRQEKRYWERRKQADKEYAGFLKTHQEDGLAELRAHERFEEDLKRSILAFAEKGTPEIINSEAFDSVLRARARLTTVFDRAFERLIQVDPPKAALLGELHFVREEWQHRNESMAQNIVGYAGHYRSKRIVVVVGAEHRYVLRDLLRNSTALTLREYWEVQ